MQGRAGVGVRQLPVRQIGTAGAILPSAQLASQPADAVLHAASSVVPAAAAMIPNPFSVLYASTKSFLSCERSEG